jgi:hypothetical protein
VRFREHRGSLAESVETEVEILDFETFLEHLFELPIIGRLVLKHGVSMEPYAGEQTAVSPETWIVRIPHHGVLGFITRTPKA